MFEVKLNFENGNTETATFGDDMEMVKFLADNKNAGSRIWENDEELDGIELEMIFDRVNNS